MIKELTVAEWITTMKNGKYKQTTGYLRRDQDGGGPGRFAGHCCLGVAADMADPDGWHPSEAPAIHPAWHMCTAGLQPPELYEMGELGDFLRTNMIAEDGKDLLGFDVRPDLPPESEWHDHGIVSKLIEINDTKGGMSGDYRPVIEWVEDIYPRWREWMDARTS